LDLQYATSLQDSTLNYNNQGGTLVFDNIAAATLGGLSGAQSLALTNIQAGAVTLSVGNNSVSNNYSGSLSDGGLGGALTKLGTATLTLSGANTLTGNLTVSGGTLELPAGGYLSGNALGGAGFLVDGGTLTNGNVTSTFAGGNAIVETAGTVMTPGTYRTSNGDGTLFAVYGGYFSAGTVTMQRTLNNGTSLPTAASPMAAATTSGMYVDSTNTASPAQVCLGNLTIGTANSSCSFREDAGTVVVTNEVLLGDTSNTRVDILQVNGGTFTSLDTVNGIVLSEVNGTSSNNAELYLSGGTTFAQLIAFGTAADTTVGSAGCLIISGGTLYLGSLGINNADTSGLYTYLIGLNSGVWGALGSLAITNNLQLSSSNFTFQAADNNGVAQSINLSGTITGPGGLVKTGAGTLTLNNNADNWTGSTIVSNGLLTLVGTTGVTNSPTIYVSSPGILDVSGRTDDSLTLGVPTVNQTLEGNGTVNGKLIVGTHGTVAPGAAVTNTASLAVTGSVTLGGTNVMNLNRTNSPNSDQLTAPSIAAGGTLTVANVGDPLVAGDTFKLFPTPPTGKFSVTNLPALTSGLVWSNTIASNGSLTVVATGPGTFTAPTGITSISLPGNGNVVITGTNGQPGDAYYLLESTSLTLPVNQWVPVATNVLSASGNFTFIGTNVVVPGDRQQFFRLSNTNN
jgi:autotransporter-associated beta strand protein